ncbi:thioredoxin family protein [Pseudomonas sp. NPDC099000]|uniref:thioredoxin family protein n=1 Tax=Pseudomonas sp. NPDC099000 TaxID=3364488 RepID=UPI00383A7D6A
MRSATGQNTLAPVYRKALKTWRPVILYFGSQHCPACEMAGPIFRQIAETYRHHAHIYMLDTAQSPRHPNVTGTPTVLFYKEGKLQKKLKGIGTEETLKEDFARHIGKVKPARVKRKPTHNLAWLRQTFRRLCTVPRSTRRLNRRVCW